MTNPRLGTRGRMIGDRNRERVLDFYIKHVGCTRRECALALQLSPVAVGRHIATIRKEWKSSALKKRRKGEIEGASNDREGSL